MDQKGIGHPFGKPPALAAPRPYPNRHGYAVSRLLVDKRILECNYGQSWEAIEIRKYSITS